MKAIQHPEQGWILVDDRVPTDELVTFKFVDSDPPEVGIGEEARWSLVLDGDLVRRVWSVVVVGYSIPVGELFRELTDDELSSVLRVVFPEKTGEQIATLVFLFRAVAQTELHSIDQRVVSAKSMFGSILGVDRITHLFRQR